MFNLLGSIFGYGQSSPTVATESSTCINNNEEASQSTSGLVVASTTPTVNQSTQTQTKVVDLTNSVAGATTSSQASNLNNSTNTTSSPADWVIVDRSEAAVEKCNKAAAVDVSTSMTASIDDLQKSTVVAPAVATTTNTTTNNITDSVMLGSFFDKNAAEDEEFNKKYGNAANMHQTKDWLITPLPCLTSITASQRSIVDNDPMENLLIEHPSMSVFVAATSSAEDNDDDDDDTATLENEDEEMNVEEEEKKQQPPALRELEKNVMVKSMSEKRKALGSPKICDSKPPGGKRHQKHKKNKKSAPSPNSSVSPASSSSTINGSPNTGNKENLTVLLPHDFKKQSASGAQSLVSALLLNKNQMKRANKNSVFKNTSANNVKHRKYHKLQQPFQQSSRPVF